jgi:hypothetical protein
MKPKHTNNRVGQDGRKIVPAPHVRQFMRYYRLQLSFPLLFR